MKILQSTFEDRPLISSSLLVLLSVGMLFLVRYFGAYEEALFNWPRLLVQNGISLTLIALLIHYGWQRESGFTRPINRWGNRWYWATIPMLLIGFLNLTMVQWQSLEVSGIKVFAWLLANFSTGLFEESLLRGFCFYLLYRAWGNTRQGLYKAAFMQGLIFGLVHLVNLYQMPVLDVVAQVIYATLIGIGFAGLVFFTRSIWPAVIVHSFINSVGTINEFFNPEYVADADSGPGLIGYLVLIVVIFVISTLPGCWFLKKAELRAA